MNLTIEPIQAALQRVEKEAGVRVLFAVESGPRAWGFASRDSGHDVRFIYTHAADDDLPENARGHAIAVSNPGNIALSGRDLPRALGLLRDSDPALLEGINSPIVYRADPAFALLFGLLASEFSSAERTFRHHLQLAQNGHQTNRPGERVRLGEYLSVLRSLLACRWIEQGRGPVPGKFETLVDELVADVNLRFHLAVLVARKRAGAELDEAQRVPAVDAFLAAERARLEKIAPLDPATPVAEKLDQFLREFCRLEAA